MTTPNQTNSAELKGPITAVCSFAERAELEAIEPVGELSAAILRDNGGSIGALGSPARAALIEAVRAGKHVELKVRVLGFRQKDGFPNKNFLRFKSSKLEQIGASFAGKPFLLDHVSYSQAYRKGTILESEAVPLAGGWVGFRMALHVVKPDAVISVLDGTIDQFSIGWDPSGPIFCTVHNVDVRSRKSCYRLENCYPGKAIEVDGETKIAEYEWQSTEGRELSGVNTPAVSGTKIENVSPALAAELGLNDELSLDDKPTKDQKPMRFPLLLAALAIPVVGDTDPDDAKLAERVKDLSDAKLAAEQERDSAVTKANELTTKLAALEAENAKLLGAKVDTILEAAYKGGKLIRAKDAEGKSTPSPREARLRKIAKGDGVEALEAELAEMPVVVPVGRAELSEEDPNPKPGFGSIAPTVLASTAKQLGLKTEDLEDHANKLAGRDSGGNN